MAESPEACCLLDGVSVVLAAAATTSVSFRMFLALASSSLTPSSSSLEDARSSRLTSSGSPARKAHSSMLSVAPPNGTASLLKSAR